MLPLVPVPHSIPTESTYIAVQCIRMNWPYTDKCTQILNQYGFGWRKKNPMGIFLIFNSTLLYSSSMLYLLESICIIHNGNINLLTTNHIHMVCKHCHCCHCCHCCKCCFKWNVPRNYTLSNNPYCFGILFSKFQLNNSIQLLWIVFVFRNNSKSRKTPFVRLPIQAAWTGFAERDSQNRGNYVYSCLFCMAIMLGMSRVFVCVRVQCICSERSGKDRWKKTVMYCRPIGPWAKIHFRT